MSSDILPMTAIALERRFEPDAVVAALGWPEERSAPYGKVVTAPGGRLYLFNFGALVLEGSAELSPTERERLEAAANSRLLFQTKETTPILFDPDFKSAGRARVGWDRLTVRDRDSATMETVAYLLGQSAALDRYALETDTMIAEAILLARGLSEGGRLPSLWGRDSRKVGEIIHQQLELARWFILLDPPEPAWENPEIFDLYRDLTENLDLHDQHKEIRHKLDAIEDALDTTLSLWQARQSWVMEVAIVVLIVIEIGMAVIGGH